jgi:hypothetical protein
VSFALGTAWSRATRRSTEREYYHSKRAALKGPEIGFVGATENVRWKVCSNIKSSVSSDGVFLVDQADEFCLGLDAVGAQTWITIECSPSGIKFDDILDVLETHFDAPRDQLAEQLRSQLQRLHALGFVEKQPKT